MQHARVPQAVQPVQLVQPDRRYFWHFGCPAAEAQTSSSWHMVSQVPQWLGSCFRSAQELPHWVSPGSHDAWQRPRLHTSLPKQAVLHEPQCAPDEVRLAQSGKQAVVPMVQLGFMQCPLKQIWPSAQGMLHAPQLPALPVRSTQAPLHSVAPGAHMVPQWPFMQSVVPIHVRLQPPQA
jgi:hypothetical protein